MTGKPLWVFYGHHKCATMWINRILSSACARLGLTFRAVYDEDGFDRDLPSFIKANNIDFLSYGNADKAYLENLGEHRGLHIIRDPRDIVVSAYFSHLKSHVTEKWPSLIEYREKLKTASKDDGLAMEIENRATEFHHLLNWDYSQDHILEIRFEECVRHSYDQFLKVFDHLRLLDDSDYGWLARARTMGLDVFDYISRNPTSAVARRLKRGRLPGAELLAIVWRNRFQAQASGRRPGEEDTASHYRKGEPGDWVNHFTEEHKRLFKNLYPDLLLQLGYEASDDW
jgi:hypothetical protein